MRTFNGFMTGLLAPLRGLAILRDPKNRSIRRYAIIPIFLSAILILGAVFGGAFALFSWVPVWVGAFLDWAGMGQGVLFEIARVLGVLIVFPALLFALVLFFVAFSRLIGAPFYSLLAENSLQSFGVLKESSGWGEFVRVAVRMFAVSLWKTFVFAFIGIVLFVLSFIPVLGAFAAFGFLMIAAFDTVDFSLEAMQYSFRERIRFFWRHFSTFSGFALTLGLVFLIPGLNFFLFPASVVGAADMVRRLTSSAGISVKDGITQTELRKRTSTPNETLN